MGYRQCICAKGHVIPKNKSYLYYVNNNTVFHNEQFVKCHLFTANIVLVSVEQSQIDVSCSDFWHILHTSENMQPILNINIWAIFSVQYHCKISKFKLVFPLSNESFSSLIALFV